MEWVNGKMARGYETVDLTKYEASQNNGNETSAAPQMCLSQYAFLLHLTLLYFPVLFVLFLYLDSLRFWVG